MTAGASPLIGQTAGKLIRSMHLHGGLATSAGGHVSDIGYGLCVSDPAHFARAFKAQFGVRPSQYWAQPDTGAWLANYFRPGACPSAVLVLIMQRTDDIDVKIEEGRFIANRIAEDKFVELPGDDHLFWVSDTQKELILNQTDNMPSAFREEI
jgi:AraC-like DNA-binding protein